MVKISAALAASLTRKPHKYNACRTKCLHGHDHDSRKEAMHCIKLHQEQREGKIRNLYMQTEYDLTVKGKLVCRHILDFDYDRWNPDLKEWCAEVVDVKGVKLPVWVIKHKLFLALFPEINYVIV